MSQTATFGRRQSKLASPQAQPGARPPARPQPRPPVQPPAPTLEREAYAHILTPDPSSEDAAFTAWRRAQTPRWIMTWVASLALCSPGAICFLLHASRPVAGGIEVAGMLATLWLRRQRRRRLTQISGWNAEG